MSESEIDWVALEKMMDKVRASGDPLGLGQDPELSKHLLAGAKLRMEQNPEDVQAKEHYEALYREVEEWWGQKPEEL